MSEAQKHLQQKVTRILCKLKVGAYRKSGTIIFTGERIEFAFGYWPALNAEIKTMRGHRYHGFEAKPRKIWSVDDCTRNRFQLAYMLGDNPYAHYEQALMEVPPRRELYEHQRMMLQHIMTRRHCIFACEMGTGKTLVFIEAAERAGCQDHEIWYVGPRAGVKAVSRELVKWEARFEPVMMTYEGMKKRVANWIPGAPAPKFICFDESSKLKGPTSQQSLAAAHLCDSVRSEHGYDGYILLMSGTPAPKTPVDWWQQCEVACPGFIKEGTVGKFKQRLALTELRENLITGGAYPHHIAWLDDERKCSVCGQFEGAPHHHSINADGEDFHVFKASKNEIAYLYERMDGLVLVKLKKDCLDLPEKQYQVIHVKPTVEIIRAAQLIKAKSTRAITALTLMREISDGFQYIETPSGQDECPNCRGRKNVAVPIPEEPLDILAPQDVGPFKTEVVPCDNCNATGLVTTYKRETEAVGSPKDEVFIDELDQHSGVGRYIVWGGFTGTIERLVGICHQQGWSTLKVDGKGYIGCSPLGEKLDSDELLDAMDRSHPRYDELLEKLPRLCFVGHPQAGGMALTLTASPTELFYSNCFNGEARMQAEDRGHRPGMDVNRGLTIKDLIMLPTDQLVLDNLRTKKKLQNLTMGQLSDAFTKT